MGRFSKRERIGRCAVARCRERCLILCSSGEHEGVDVVIVVVLVAVVAVGVAWRSGGWDFEGENRFEAAVVLPLFFLLFSRLCLEGAPPCFVLQGMRAICLGRWRTFGVRPSPCVPVGPSGGRPPVGCCRCGGGFV